ncbi:MAG: holin-associated N-acetylmuramidase [Planktomarina sp.]
MQTVHDIAEDILAREGGYVNDPDDLGGATNHGVTLSTMRRLGLDLDMDGDIDASDVQRLSKSDAIEIFKKHYFYGPNIHQLPEALHPSVFDMQVNAGGNAVKILQRVLTAFDRPATVDGAIGPQTITAAQNAFSAAPHHLVDAYGIARRNYYYALADARPPLRKYARRRDGGKGGWITRAEDFIAPRYHYSDQDHAQRIRSWA